jgi:hypothetical protein
VSPHGLDAKSIETGRGALQPRAELARAKKQQNYSSAAPPKGRGILSVFLAGWNAISRGRIQSFAFRARDWAYLGRDDIWSQAFQDRRERREYYWLVYSRPSGARGTYEVPTLSCHAVRRLRLGCGVGGQMDPTWTELGLRWTARSRLNLPTPHYLPPTTASTIWCGIATPRWVAMDRSLDKGAGRYRCAA